MSLQARLARVERAVAAAASSRRALSHAQLVRAAAGRLPDDEEPEELLREGEQSTAEFIVAAVRTADRLHEAGTPAHHTEES